MNYLYPPFLKNVKDFKLVERENTIIAAFSGGKDSVTLLLLLKELQKDIDFKLIAAYFNHHIRQDSREEERWVKDFCSSLQVELKVGSGDVTTYKEQRRINLENAASIMRTRFLEETAAACKNARIATAHTKSDLVETFFIKLLRGSGSRGLSAIYSRVGETIIRPLLIFSQKEILSFLERKEMSYYLDPSNEENVFLRNKIRHILIPEMEKIEPDLENRIFKTVAMIQDEYRYFKELADAVLRENLILGKILPVKILTGQSIAVQRHILREYIRLLKGDLLAVDFEHVENILAAASKTKGITVPGLELKFHKNYIYPGSLSIPTYNYTVNVPGILAIEEIGKKVIIEKTNSYAKPGNHLEIIIPYSSVKFPLTVRSPVKTDKYTKLNSLFAQDVFEMIREAGFPAAARNLCPLVQNSDGRIIWVNGAAPAESFKVNDENEKPFLKISCRPGRT